MGATVYWDVDGSVAGAGGATPAGTWDGANAFWNSVADGTGGTTAWAAGDTAVFAAGTNATGSYAVTLSGTQSIGGLRFEEGTVTLSGGTLSLAGQSDIFVDAGRSATISSALAAGPAIGTTLTKSGAGTLILTGSNVAGNLTMVVNGGVVSVGTTSNLISGRLTLDGGTLQATESMTTGNVLALGMAGGTFDVAATKVLTAGTTAITGGGSLTKTGAGTLTLGIASTYGGATTVSQGILSAASFIPARTAVTVATGATIDFLNASGTLGSLSGGGTVAVTGASSTRTLTIGGDYTSTTFNGVLQAPTTVSRLAIAKVGAGTLTLQLASTTAATGATTISGGTLNLDFSAGALNSMLGSTPTTLSGGTLQITGRSGSSTVSQSLNGLTVGAGGGRIVMVPNGATATNLTTGALTSTAAGGTLLIQAPASTSVRMATALDTAAINPRVVFTNGTAGSFDWAANTGSASDTIAFAGYAPLDLTAGTDTSNSSLTGSAVLTGARNTSTLKITSSGTGQSLGLATLTLGLNGGGLLYTGADNYTISNGSLQSNNGELIVQQHGAGSLTVSAVIKDGTTAPTLLTKAGSGNLVLTGTNTFTGGIFLNEGTLTVSSPAQLGAHTASTAITIRDGATFATTADMTILGGTVASSHSFSLSGGSAKFDVAPSTTLTLSGIVSGSGGMTLTNTGTLVLGAAATFTGPAIVGAGATLKGGVNTFINASTGGGLAVAAGGLVDLNDFTLTVGGLSGAGTITNSSATPRVLTVGGNHLSSTFSGLLSGAVSLTKNGGGTLTLSGVNTQTGTLTVGGGGTITVTGGGTFGASTIPVTLTAGIMDLAGTSHSVGILAGAAAGTVRSSGSAAAVTFSMGNGSAPGAVTNFAGVIEDGDGTLSLVKNGAGTVTLSGLNTYTGSTQVNEGMLLYGNKTAQPVTGTTTVAAGAGIGLGLGGAGFYSLADFESLYYDNTLAGVILTPTSSVGIDTSAADFDLTLSLAASPRGLVKTGTNTLTLSGTNAHSGGTSVLGGTVVISSDANLGAAAGPLNLGGSSTLRVLGTGSMTSNRALSIVSAATFDLAERTRTYTINSPASTAGGAITKSGPGTLVLNTDINLNGNGVTVNNGVLEVGGTLTGTAVSPFTIGNTALAAGNGGGALVLTGAGTLVSTIADTSDILRIGNIAGGFGSLTVGPGVNMSISRWRVGMAGTGIANILNGATVTLGNYNIGGSAATGVGTLNIAGGTMNGTMTNGNGAWGGARYEQNIGVNLGGGNAGGLLDMSNSPQNFGIVQNNGAGVGIVNLITGGTLKIRGSVTPVTMTTGRAELNFHGGTLEYAGTAANTSFISTGVTAVNVFSAGAIINSGGQNITVPAPLVAPAGRGVESISASGSGYFTAPYVQITGGGGNNDATAVAQIDAGGNITGIIITNPGTGYTSEPTVTLVGGTNDAIGTATATLNVANVSGGLTKTGNGTLALTGVNTYTGATVVNGGALSILPTSLPNTSGFLVGSTGNGLLDLYADGVAATLTLGGGINITLGGATSAGSLGFQLGAPGTSDQIVFTGGGGLIVNAGGGHINAVALSGFGVGSYQLISGASSLGTLQLGALPSGYTYSLSQNASSVTLNVLALAPAGDLYWTGAVNNSWGGISGTSSNWATTPNGATNAGYAPGPDNLVYFSATNASTSAFTTTLDSAASIKGLRILSSGTGAVTIAPGASSSLTIGSDGIIVQAGAPASTTISAPVTFGAAQTLSVADAGSVLTISGAVSGGPGNSTQATPGTNVFLTITGAGSVGFGSTGNTFTGDILVDGGGFNVDNDRDWGVATVANSTSHSVILDNGGRLNVTGSVNPGASTTTNYNLVKIGGGGGIIDVSAGATLSLDDLGQLYGSGALTKTGVGVFVLRNQNTFAGTLTVAGGTLRMSGGTAFGLNTAGTSILSGATLDLNDQTVTDTEPLTIAGHGLASAPAGVITNSAAGSASFAGPITLAADSTIGSAAAGGMTLSGGVTGAYNLIIANLAAGGTALSTAAINNSGTITNSGTGTGTTTLSGIIGSNVQGVIQNSATSTLVLSGANTTWAGGVTIKQGTLTATTSTGALGTGNIILGDSAANSNNATLNANVAGTFANNIFLASGTTGLLTIQTPNSSTTQVLSGSITGANNLVVALTNNAGLTLSGSVNHAGSLTANGTGAGTITISGVIGTNVTSVTQTGNSNLTLSGNNLYTGLTTVDVGSTLNIGSGSTAGSILGDVLNNGTLNFNRSNAYIYAGDISGSGALTKSGAGVLTLTGAISYTGITTINGGTLSGPISANSLVLGGGVWETSGSVTRSLGTGSGQVRWNSSANGGFSAQGGALTVTLSGTPSLVWDLTENFVTGTGQLLFGSTTADNGVTFTNNIDLNGAARTVQVLDNTGSTTDKAVLSGVLSNGSLTKTGAGVLELTGANTYSGSTLVSAGTLSVSSIGGTGVASSGLGAGNATISIGSGTTTAGTLTYTGAGETTDRAVNLAATTTGAATINSSGTGALTWQGNVTSAGTTKTFTLGGDYTGGSNVFSGTINLGTGNLAKAGAGTWELTAANTYVNTTISAGTLKLSGAGTLGNGSLTMGGVAGVTPTLEIGSGVTLAPPSITYTGTTGGAATINGAGTLDLGTAGYTVTVADNTANAVDMYWSMNTLTGSGTFIKAGAGTLDISGIANNNFTGSIQVNAGAVLGQAAGANLILNGGVYEGSGTFTRSLGTTGSTVQWAPGANGGFSANGGALTVTINNSATPALVWDGTPQFVSGAGALLFGSLTANNVVTFANDIDLNGAARTVQVVDNTSSTADKAVLSGVLSNGGLTKTGNGVLELSASNTFAGVVSVSGGTLQYSTLANLGAGTSAIAMNGANATLSFVGGTSLDFTRPVAFTAAGALDASGTGGAVLTHSGVISTSGNNAITLRGSGAGVITGGINITGVEADVFVDSGTWTLSGTKSLLSDDIWVRGASSVLNLNATSIIGNNQEDDSSGIGAGQGGVINLNANNVLDPTNWSWLRLGTSDSGGAAAGYSTTPGTGTLNTNGFNFTLGSATFVLGGLDPLYRGVVTGAGTLTMNGASALYSGEIDANLAGSGAISKVGTGTVILRGDGTARTGATTVVNGVLQLDYTTNNARKLSSGTTLTTYGGTLLLTGSSTQSTLEVVGGTGLTLLSGGSNIELQHGTGQTLTLQLGAISRPVGSGVNFTLSSGSTVETTTALAGWATYGGNRFATLSGNQVAGITATSKDDVSTWTTGDNVTNTAGYSGTVGSVAINSLVLESASPSTITIGSGKALTITGGGILMTENAGATTITGGRLISGLALSATGGELVIHQHSTNDLTLASAISGLQAITKVGAGTLVLTGSNNGAGRPLYIGEGTVRATGGNQIGDYSTITFGLDASAVLDMTDSTERVGGLTSSSSTVSNGARVLLGTTGKIIVDMRADNSYYGTIWGGDGTVFVKTGPNLMSTNSLRTEFTGRLVVNQGGIRMDGNTSAEDVFSLAKAITLNNPGSYLIGDQDSTSGSLNIFANAAVVTLANTSTVTSTAPQGLVIVSTPDGTRTETVGQTTVLSGQNSIYVNTSTGTNAARIGVLTMAGLTRQNRATLQLVAQNLGAVTAPLGPAGRITVTGATTASLGGIGGIIPYIVGNAAPSGSAAESTIYGFTGNSFVTYDANGFRPLNLTSEYEQLVAAGGITVASNVRYSGAADLTLDGVNKTMNSLLVDNASTTAGQNITLAGGGGALNVASGAFLFTGSATPQGITVSGFSGITTSLSTEYILHVMNTSAAGVTIASPFTTVGAALTKSGLGTLILTSDDSTYTGPTTVNLGVLQIDKVDKLGNNGSGGLVLNGGTLRFGAVFDPSTIPLTLGLTTGTADVTATVGGTFDTNGLDIVLANSIGQGGNGGLIKIGAGNLTLNAAATHTGGTTVTAGTLTFGVAQALPVSSDLVLNGGTLDAGSFASTLGMLSLSASSTLLNGGGLTFDDTVEINGGASRTLTVTHTGGVVTFNGEFFVLVDRGGSARTLTIAGTGDVTINSQIVDGTFTGNITKTGAGLLTLTGDNIHSGNTSVTTSGALAIGSDTALGTGSFIVGTATISAVGGDRTLANVVQQNNNVITTFTGTNGITFTNTHAILAAANNPGLINNISGAGNALTFAGPTTVNLLTAARTWTISGSGDTYFNGGITTTTAFLMNLVYTGTGTLTFGGANNALGTTTLGSASVAAGSVNVLAGSNIGTGNATIFSGVLNLNNSTQNIGTLTMGNGPAASTSSITLNGGALNLGGDVTYTTSANSGTATISGGTVNLLADRTFTINDSTATTVEMLMDATLANGDATARGIIKAGAGTLVLNQAGTYTGNTSINAGTLKLAVAQSMAGALQFGSSTGTSTAGTLDLTDASATFASMVSQGNTATPHQVILGAGQTLQINGNVTVGTNGTATNSRLTFTGANAAAWNVTGTTLTFRLGGASTGTSTNVLDLSALPVFNASLGSGGAFRLGSTETAGSSADTNTLLLAVTSTITAATLDIGGSTNHSGVNTLSMGAGLTTLNVDTLNVGSTATTTAALRGSGVLNFASATDGSVRIRANNGTGAVTMNVLNSTANTNTALSSSVLLAGHQADVLIGTLTIANRAAAGTNTTADSSGTLTFDQGTFNASNVVLARRAGGALTTGNVTGTLTLGGTTAGTTATLGAVTMSQNAATTSAGTSGNAISQLNISGIGTTSITTLNMGSNTVGGTGSTGGISSTVNVSGSTTTIGSIAMTSNSAVAATGATTATGAINISAGTVSVTGGITMGTTTVKASNSVNNTISITGTGSLSVGDNITKGATFAGSTHNAAVILNGGTLNMNGRNIGAAGAAAVNLDAQQGTLRNLGQLNGGGTLTKTTAGLLVVEGTNTHTGATQVNGGIVQVGSAGAGSIASSPVNVAGGATLAGSGTIGGATVITSGAVLQPGDVTTVGTTTSTITGHQTLTFTAASTALTVETGAQIHLGVSSPTQAGSISFTGGQFQYNGNSYSTAAALFSSEPGALAAWNVSPTAASNHDMIKLVNGTLSIGDRAGGTWGEGSVLVNGVLGSVQAGQVFNLIDWNGVTIIDGTFDTGGSAVYDATTNVIAGDLDLVALGAGYGWDVSAFAQYGIIVVVPEPSRVLFLLLGLSSLLLRRRRRK